MLTALLVGLLGPQPQTVTFSHPCAHSSVVLEALGQELGVKMGPGGSVLQDYFAVKFTDRPIEDVKRVIAETLNAVWVQRGEYLVLDRGPAQLRIEQDEEDASLRRGIEKFKTENPVKEFSLDLANERMIALSKAGSDSQKIVEALGQFRAVMPRDLLPAELVRAFPIESLTALKDGSSKRYSFSDNGESDLPREAREAVRRYVDNLGRSFEAAQRIGADNYFGADGGPLLIGQSNYSLVISKGDGHIEFLLQQVPKLDTQFQGQVGGVRFSVFKDYVVRGGKKPVLPALTKDYSLSPIERSLVYVVSSASWRPAIQNVPTDEDRSVALRLSRDLVANEPLSTFGCAPLFAVAEEATRDFVALVSDQTAFDGEWMNYVQSKDLGVIWNWWLQRMTLREDEATGIMKVQPRYPRYDRANRYDRAAISRYINSYLAKGYNDLDSISELAAASDDDQILARQSDIASRFLGIPRDAHFGNWLAFRAFGELSPAQRRQARADGVVLQWGALSPIVKSAVEKLLLSSNASFGQSVPPPTTGFVSGGRSTEGGLGRGAMSRLKSVPADTRVEFRVGTGELLRPETDRLDFWSFGPNLFDVNSFASMRKHGSSFEFFNFEKAAVTSIEMLHVAFWVPRVGVHYLAVQVDDTSKNTKFVPLDKLPEPWKTQLAEAIKKAGGGTQ